MEQKYLLRQYVYACETFLPKPPTDATSAFVLSMLSSQFAYTISTVPNPNSFNEKPTGFGNPSTRSVKDELTELKTLLDEGLITQEDYDAKKQQLLGV